MNTQNQLATASHRDAPEVEPATVTHGHPTGRGVNVLAIVDELTRILAALGDTADAVAGNLRRAGIRGTACTTTFLNPIVRFAKRQVMVEALSLDVIKPGTLRLRFDDGRKGEVVLPHAVQDFLRGFNKAAYSELELPHGQT